MRCRSTARTGQNGSNRGRAVSLGSPVKGQIDHMWKGRFKEDPMTGGLGPQQEGREVHYCAVVPEREGEVAEAKDHQWEKDGHGQKADVLDAA